MEKIAFGIILLLSCVSAGTVSTNSPPQNEIEHGVDSGQEDFVLDGPFNATYVDGFNSSLGHNETNHHAGFLHGFVEALTVILVSELGDKTFFIAAIMAMRNNKLTVFLGAISALAAMTILSALLGWVVTKFIPRIYTYYTCTAIMFLFGLKMLWEAYKMKPEEAQEIQQEVENELVRRGSIASNLPEAHQAEEAEPMPTEETPAEPEPEEQPKSRKVTFKDNSWFGKHCYKIFKCFVNCFTMTFLAEWGDRSQLATIVLASVNDVGGVCIGGVLGHSITTGLAVIAGALIAKKISVRMVTLIGALIFIGFAIASLFFDPESEEIIDIDLS